MPKLADRVKETTTTTGTGAISMGGAVSGFRAFSAAFATGDVTYYCIDGGAEWEVGIGTLTTGSPWTMARTTVLASSNAGAAVNFGAGVKNVFCTLLAQDTKSDYQEFTASGTWTKPSGLSGSERVIVELWGGGGGSGTGGAGAGGGGAYARREFLASQLAGTVSVAIGAGGTAAGTAGGTSSFGSHIYAYGGGGATGSGGGGGGGGGGKGAGGNGVSGASGGAVGGLGYAAKAAAAAQADGIGDSGGGGAHYAGAAAGCSLYGGGGGAGNSSGLGGHSVYGGGGGSGGSGPGLSVHGGNGGNNSNGVAPGGGAGGGGYSGARGECRVLVIRS